jgi:hypothetical protein
LTTTRISISICVVYILYTTTAIIAITIYCGGANWY